MNLLVCVLVNIFNFIIHIFDMFILGVLSNHLSVCVLVDCFLLIAQFTLKLSIAQANAQFFLDELTAFNRFLSQEFLISTVRS